MTGWLYWPSGRKQLAHFSDDGLATLCGLQLGGEVAEAYQEGREVRSWQTDAALTRCRLCTSELAE